MVVEYGTWSSDSSPVFWLECFYLKCVVGQVVHNVVYHGDLVDFLLVFTATVLQFFSEPFQCQP